MNIKPLDGLSHDPNKSDEPVDISQPESTNRPTSDKILKPKDYESPVTKKNINGSKKDDKIKGSKKNDFISGKKGDDKINGLRGDDILVGDKGNDVLKGSKGNDYLDGSKGTDILIGGGNADVFQISRGVDVVRDFNIKQGDRIALGKKGFYTITDSNDGVLVKANAKAQLFLKSIDYNDVIEAGVDLFVQPIGE